MRKTLFGVIFSFIILCSFSGNSAAQTIELLAGNTLNGAVNGSLLGGATMAVTNNPDFDPLRVGVGLGTLYGIGVGAYDISYSKGDQLLVAGSFNDGNNSSIIVLLDTFYGAAAGSIIASSIMLVADEPLVDGLQYGAGVGAWVGFGFGLFDAFVLSERMTSTEDITSRNPNSANGLVALNLKKGKSVGFLSPSLISTYNFNADFSREVNPTISVVNVKLNF